MGTRCNILVVDKFDRKIVLYKHWDGYPAGIIPYIVETLKYMKKYAYNQTHWWHYADVVAGMLIAVDWDVTKQYYETFKHYWDGNTKVDIRPVDGIYEDIEFLYIVDVGEDRKGEWVVKILSRPSFNWKDALKEFVEVAIVKITFDYNGKFDIELTVNKDKIENEIIERSIKESVKHHLEELKKDIEELKRQINSQ